MNDARRKEIQRALTLIGEAKGILELALSQEQDDLDNMPEELQGYEEGQIAEDMVDVIGACRDGLRPCDYRLQGGDAGLGTNVADEMREEHRECWRVERGQAHPSAPNRPRRREAAGHP